MARYEPEQLDDAIAELEGRYLAGEGAPFASIWSPCVAMVRALGRRDWDALRGCCAPSFVIRDSYSGGWGDVTDREAAVRTWFEMVDAIPDFEVVQRRIVDIAGDTVLAELAVTYGPDGEVRYFSLAHVGPDGLDRLESFRDDDLEEARRAFGRLAGDALTNRAVETFRRWVGRFEARDWDGCRGLCIPEFRADDVRPVVRNHEDIDRAALDIELQAAAGVRSMALRPIATRGDRLALIAIKWIGDDELFTPETLSVVESTDDGRLVRTTAYALEQLDDAVAELDQRFLDGEAAPYAAVWAHQVAATRAVNAHDWDAFRAELADDCESVDHITGGWRTRRGADAVIGEVRGAVELLGGDARGCTTQVVAIAPRALLTLHRWTSGDSEGISEMAVVSVTGIGRGGITSMHSFGPDDLGAARAVYRSLAGDDLTNAAIESYRGWADHLAARDWEQANTFGAPGLRVEDVRPVVGDVDVGRRVGANAQAMASIGVVGLSVRPIATRGARLALAAVRWSDEEDSTASSGEETLNVVEVDADGRFVAVTIHAPEALDAAIDELDRRYLEGEGAPFARWLDHLLVRGNATMNAHDWEGLRALYDPEVRVTDHATGGWGDATGIDDFLDGIRALVDAMPGTRVMTTAVPAVSAGAAVCVMRLAAPQHDFEHTTVLLHRRGTRGITSVDAFAPSQLDEALARFRALASSRPLTNRCTETAQRWNDSFARRDWDAAARLAEPDFVLDDRRPVIGFDERGADAMADVRHLAARGVGHIRHETIATRGESLALARVSSAEENNIDGFVTEALAVIALSDRRRLASFTMFNSDELDAAIAELEARYLAGEAAEHADVWRVLVRWRDTFNARDWDGSRAALSPQFVVTDHAPVGFGVRAPGETEEMARAFVAVSPDTRMDFVEVVALAADRVMLHVVNASGSHGDAEFATEGWQVIRIADGLLHSLDMYALEQRDEALARFEALARAHE